MAQALPKSLVESIVTPVQETEVLALTHSSPYFNVLDEYYHPGNNELQVYLKSQVTFSRDYTRLTAEYCPNAVPKNKFKKLNVDPSVESIDFKSGEVTTKGKYSVNKKNGQLIKNGAIEVTAKVPYNYGLWPAIWMLSSEEGQDMVWPNGLEIDMLEHMGVEPHVFGTVHYGLNRTVGGEKEFFWNWSNNHTYIPPANWVQDGFVPSDPQLNSRAPTVPHNYGFEWNFSDASQGMDASHGYGDLTWYFDGKIFYQLLLRKDGVTQRTINGEEKLYVNTDRVGSDCTASQLSQWLTNSALKGFNGDYYLLLNLAVGGNGVKPAPVKDKSFQKSYMDILSVKRFIL